MKKLYFNYEGVLKVLILPLLFLFLINLVDAIPNDAKNKLDFTYPSSINLSTSLNGSYWTTSTSQSGLTDVKSGDFGLNTTGNVTTGFLSVKDAEGDAGVVQVARFAHIAGEIPTDEFGTRVSLASEHSDGNIYDIMHIDAYWIDEASYLGAIDYWIKNGAGTHYLYQAIDELGNTYYPSDNQKFVFGEGYNSEIYFNGSDMIIHPDSEEGGQLYIYNNTIINGNVLVLNATASWFKGKFNWTTADDWNSFDGSLLTFNESKLSTIYYNATQSQIITGTVSGTLSSTQHPNGNYDSVTLNITESTGSPALDIRINFTNVESFTQGIMRYYTTSLAGSYPIIEVWDYEDSEWEDYPQMEPTLTFRTIEQSVFDSSSHIENGVVQMRIYKASNGNINNKYYIDWLAIAKGFGVPAGEEVDPYSWHRNILDSGDFNTTGNVLVSNITINDKLCNSTGSCFTLTELNISSSSSGGFTTDQNNQLNTTGNVTFNSINISTTATIYNKSADLYINNTQNSGDIIISTKNGSGVTQQQIKLDGGNRQVIIDAGTRTFGSGSGAMIISGKASTISIIADIMAMSLTHAGADGTALVFNNVLTKTGEYTEDGGMVGTRNTVGGGLNNGASVFHRGTENLMGSSMAYNSGTMSLIGEYTTIPQIVAFGTSYTGTVNSYGNQLVRSGASIVSNTGTITHNAYGLKLEGWGTAPFLAVGLTEKLYAIYSDGGTVALKSDNQKLTFGASEDTEIFFDGTNQIYNSTTNGVHTFYNSTGLGTIRYGSALTSTTINNDSDALESFNLGGSLYDIEGNINHSAFGECYSQINETDFNRPVNVTKYQPINKTEYPLEQINKIKDNFEYTENETHIIVEYQETTYPNKKLTDVVDLTCEQAMQRQALALINKNVNVYTNITEFDTGIMAEDFYSQSKTIKSDETYLDKFSDKTKLSDKKKHYAYVEKTIDGKKFELLSMEDRIVALEGAVNELLLRVEKLEKECVRK